MTTMATSLRIEKKKMQQIDSLASAMGRSRNWVLNKAVDNFLGYQDWFVSAVQEAIETVDAGKFAPNEEVEATFMKYEVGVK